MLIKDMIISQEWSYNLLDIKWNLLSKEEKTYYTYNILQMCKKNRNLFGYNFIQHYEEKKGMTYTDNLDALWNNIDNTVNCWNYEEKWNKRVELWSNRCKIIYNI